MNRIRHSQGYELANAELDAQGSTQRFRRGSITKQFTAGVNRYKAGGGLH